MVLPFSLIKRFVPHSFPYSGSKLYSQIKEPNFNTTDIDILQDELYPNKNTSGKLAIGNFTFTKDVNIDLNFMLNENEFSSTYLGLSRGVIYNNKTLEEEYELDFVSQFIKKGVINKYYIYLPPFFNSTGNIISDTFLEIGRFPQTFDIYREFSSYTPLNERYPKKWSVKLSHILFGDITPRYIPYDKKRDIYADVIFTESYKQNNNYIPSKYKEIFNSIFIDNYNCEVMSNVYKCPIEILNNLKLYFVFNGYAHLISNHLLFHQGTESEYNYTNFRFTTEIEYISIDSYIFGNYHKLFDGENNTVRFVYPKDKSYILDVGEITGYENRKGTKKEVLDIEYLRDLERNLKERENNLNVTLKEIEEQKKILNKREGELRIKEDYLNIKENQLNEREKEIEKEMIDLKNEIIYLKEELNKMNKTLNNLNCAIETDEEKIKTLENEKNELNKSLNNLTKVIEIDEEKIKTLEKEKNELNNSLYNLTNVIEIDKEKIKTLLKEKNELNNSLNNLDNLIEIDKEKIKTLEKENNELNNSLNNLTFIIEINKENIKSLEKKIENKNNEINNLNQKINDKSSKIIIIIEIIINVVLVIIIIILIIFLFKKKKEINVDQSLSMGIMREE